MPASFDLRSRPWIPVRFSGAEPPGDVGLTELFLRAHEIADITVPVPPAASGLWRVLYLIASRITGLGDLDTLDGILPWKRERREAFAARRFDPRAVEKYFTDHAAGFDLFHPARPWLQDARLVAECPRSTGINKLIIGRAAGNNLVWLSHHTDLAPRTVPAAEAAWYLLAWLYYGPSGKITARTVDGTTESNMTAGPLRSRISFHPLGRSMYESLIAGIPYPGRYEDGTDPDLAPWEDAEIAGPLGIPPNRGGLSGPLTGRFRHALLLTPSPDGTQVTDARITWAWRKSAPEVRDPYLIYQTAKGKTVQYARYAELERALWRDLDALLLHDTGSGTARQPAVFTDLLASTPPAVAEALRVRAFGFDQDGKPVDRQWFTASAPPVLSMQETAGAAPCYRDGYDIRVTREAAERVGSDLRNALRRAWAAINDPGNSQGKARTDAGQCPWLAPVLARYWAAAEDAFWQMVTRREFTYPNNTFIQVALGAYDEVTGQHARRSPRVIRAVEKARGGILSSWARPQHPPQEAFDG